jgi:hypothetical protein
MIVSSDISTARAGHCIHGALFPVDVSLRSFFTQNVRLLLGQIRQIEQSDVDMRPDIVVEPLFGGWMYYIILTTGGDRRKL